MTTTNNPGQPAKEVGKDGPTHSYRLLLILALIIFALDQVTKAWIFHNLPLDSYFPPDSIEVIEGFFYIVHIGNEGAAWGMFSGYSSLLAIFALVALVFIYKCRHSLELHRKSMQVAFGLLSGGIVGNLVDRLLHGHVIDFLDFHFPFTIPYVMPTGRYPSFNVADAGIVVGVIVYIILSFSLSKTETDAAAEK
jgi:signal peptidase II